MVILGEEDVVVTEDPEHIQDWIEEHGGRPAKVDEPGTDTRLGIIFEDEDSDENLKEISWEEFFEIMDGKDLRFVYVQNDSVSLDSQKFDFQDREGANTEMEEPEVFGNTLETEDTEEEDRDVLP